MRKCCVGLIGSDAVYWNVGLVIIEQLPWYGISETTQNLTVPLLAQRNPVQAKLL